MSKLVRHSDESKSPKSLLELFSPFSPQEFEIQEFEPPVEHEVDPNLLYVLEQAPLRARLDKKGVHVLCGRVECGTRLAEIHFLDSGMVCLDFPPGWSPSGIVWKLSNHARRRMKQGRSPKLRRYPKNDGIRILASVMETPYERLPLIAICPNCGWKNGVHEEDVSAGWVVVIPAGPEKPKN